MEGFFLDPIVEKNFSVFAMRKPEVDADENEAKNLLEYLNNVDIKYATIDLGHMELREFNKTSLADLLKQYKIPYFTTELPHYVKGYFTSEIDEIKNTLEELKGSYDGLSNKNAPSAQELKLLIDRYAKDLAEIDSHINLEIRPKTILKKILSLTKGNKDQKMTIIHLGEEKTFLEILKLLKENNVKVNVIFIQLSKYL